MEATVALITKSYNSQQKSADALLFEARVLKRFAFAEGLPFGTLEQKKFETLATVYRLNGLLEKPIEWSNFIDPLHLSKQTIRIGALANRGEEAALSLWEETARYLSEHVPLVHFEIVPLDFREVSTSVRYQEIDFIITNPVYYAQLEHRYGISRIATLKHFYKDGYYSKYGSVMFTRASNGANKTLKNQTIGAVDRHSFGGYLMMLKELQAPVYMQHVRMFGTHDEVVNGVLDGRVDVGIVRTNVLEQMQEEGKIRLDDILVLHEKHHEDFPFLVSTKLYPEWPFSKLKHTSDVLATQVLSALLAFSDQEAKTTWGVPWNYSEVHAVLEALEVYPYEPRQISPRELLHEYQRWIFAVGALFLLVVGVLVHIRNLNKRLVQKAQEIEAFNETLEKTVKKRTLQLNLANAKLKELANTDELTKIDNRRRFFDFGEKYFHAAKRNKTPLCVLSLDIDFFKHVNDTYGHHAGDEVLKLFCDTVSAVIRKSDLFGRIGGEEFSICLQNTPLQGAVVLGEKIRRAIADMEYWGTLEAPVHITVSIGIGVMSEEDATLLEVMNRADKALYVAKQSGRNQVQVA
jgi:diguanylate cyclase (GGDEF)-like protein